METSPELRGFSPPLAGCQALASHNMVMHIFVMSQRALVLHQRLSQVGYSTSANCLAPSSSNFLTGGGSSYICFLQDTVNKGLKTGNYILHLQTNAMWSPQSELFLSSLLSCTISVGHHRNGFDLIKYSSRRHSRGSKVRACRFTSVRG